MCAVLFVAVPQPDHGDFVYAYDELYLRNCDAETFGKEMYHRAQGQLFEAFIIDRHGGAISSMDTGSSTEHAYSEALRRYKVGSEATGANFIWGMDDRKGGVEAVRSWLRLREDGTTKLRIFEDKCPNLVQEFKYYKFERDPQGNITDMPSRKGENHQMDNLRYLACHRPKFVRPKAVPQRINPLVLAMRREKEEHNQYKGGVNLGPLELVP